MEYGEHFILFLCVLCLGFLCWHKKGWSNIRFNFPRNGDGATSSGESYARSDTTRLDAFGGVSPKGCPFMHLMCTEPNKIVQASKRSGRDFVANFLLEVVNTLFNKYDVRWLVQPVITNYKWNHSSFSYAIQHLAGACFKCFSTDTQRTQKVNH